MTMTLRKGSRGEAVRKLQQGLRIEDDGIYGAKTEAAVVAYQRAHGLTADGIAGPKTLSSLGLANVAADKPRRITEIIVHCEATPEGEEFSRSTLEACHKVRRFSAYNSNGKTEHIGYHYVVHLDGSIEPCRPEAIAGCHCSGHNANSIGVSYVGGCPARSVKDWSHKAKDTRTAAQKASLLKLLKELRAKYPESKIYGHRDFANKPCPSFDARTEYKLI